MEATVVSVGKAVLNGALGSAKSKAVEEVALQLGVERDVTFIGDELEMMQSFLMTADEEDDKHKVLTTWVKHVRELAYNVEDSLMDFALLSDKEPCFWCIPRTLWARRDIAKEVKELKAKVEDVSSRNLRYRLIKDGSGSRPTTAEKQVSVDRTTIFCINEAKHAAMEREKPKMNLHQLITSDEKNLNVIAVWGTSGDLGKTSEIRKSYDDQAIYKGFECRAWVQFLDPFNPYIFFKDLVRQFYTYSHEVTRGSKIGNVPGYDILKELEKLERMGPSYFADEVALHVNKKRYLIVIDGLSSLVEWDWVKTYFPDKKNGSRIIVSAQKVEIAILCTEHPYQVTELKQLSSEQAIYLFHKVMPAPDSTGPTSNSKTVHTSGNNSTIFSSELLEEETNPNDGGIDNGSSSAGKKFERSRTFGLVDDMLIGRKTEKSKLIDLICQPDDKQVISVWGMGGLGKTTLVRSVYRSQQIGGWRRAWVTALRPFNREMLLRSICLQLHKDIQENPTIKTMGYQELITVAQQKKGTYHNDGTSRVDPRANSASRKV
uniref:NB-ARC domain-containing protein n=1 Tax=Arundo donax TaxID=35708 RepID=A0A0A9D904_ARUDO